MTKILLVEDDKNLREIYGTRLKAEGYTITSAGDGEEALALAIKERPDLIISDVMMPKISGFDMLDILRSTTETKDIRVIMMTALSSEDQRQRGEALGADRYLVKSQVGIEDVVHTVHDVLADGSAAAAAPVTPVTPAQPVPVAAATPVQPPAVPVPVATVPSPVSPAPLTIPPRQPAPPAPTPVTPPVQATPVVAPQPVVATPAPVPVAPAAPAMPVAPTPVAPQPQPVAAPVAVAPTPVGAAPSAPTFAPTPPVQLPQPTAPFSTPRPLGLGDRIIQPLPSEENSTETSIADRIEAALGNVPSAEPAPSIVPAPPAPPIPPVPSAPPATPGFPPITPSELGATTPTPGLSFEETPRSSTPQQPVV